MTVKSVIGLVPEEVHNIHWLCVTLACFWQNWTTFSKIGQLFENVDSFGQNWATFNKILQFFKMWTALGKTGQLFENVDTALGKIGQNLSKLGNFLKIWTALGKTGQLCTVICNSLLICSFGQFSKALARNMLSFLKTKDA
jgi:hypothetical protein